MVSLRSSCTTSFSLHVAYLYISLFTYLCRYPLKSDCPDLQKAVNPEAEDEAWHSDPYPLDNYYFPDFSRTSCGFGWDYPAWMGYNSYEKHYLFRTGEECCRKYFPTSSNCPYEDTVQQGYYWESYHNDKDNLDDMPIKYNHTYYPDLASGTCVNGTDYPPWMAADTDFKRLYIFKRLDGCCKQWFTDWDLDGCVRNVIQGKYITLPCAENRPEDNNPACDTSTIANSTEALLGMWYPDIDGHRCKNDGAMPSWMRAEGYAVWYLFNTRAQCCAAFGFC